MARAFRPLGVTMSSQQQLYDHVASDYDAVFAPHITAHYLRKRAALLGALLDGGEGLDVGCGTGALMAALRPHGRMTGLEPSDGMLAVLRREGRGEAVRGQADALPFDDDRFDLVYSVAVFHHLLTPDRVAAALREMVRVAKPGGAVVVWDHNPRNPLWPLVMKHAPQDAGDERLVPLRELVDGLAAAGARVEAARRSGFVPGFLPRFAMPVARLIERCIERTPVVRQLCVHNVVVGRKR
jgi:SAM-dependent methyltransferase